MNRSCAARIAIQLLDLWSREARAVVGSTRGAWSASLRSPCRRASTTIWSIAAGPFQKFESNARERLDGEWRETIAVDLHGGFHHQAEQETWHLAVVRQVADVDVGTVVPMRADDVRCSLAGDLELPLGGTIDDSPVDLLDPAPLVGAPLVDGCAPSGSGAVASGSLIVQLRNSECADRQGKDDPGQA